jgi:15-cis-phytoene synthase
MNRTTADRINVKDGIVAGVWCGKKYFEAQVVVGAGDLPMLETKMLPLKYQTFKDDYWKNKELGISSLLVYLGINKRLKGVIHHNIYFSKDWKNNFDEINKTKIPSDPSFYFSIRSVTDRSIVPDLKEEIFVLIPLGAGKYKQTELKGLAEEVLLKMESMIGKFRDDLAVKKIYGPDNFAEDYFAYQGTALGLAHNFRQSLWLRPANKSKKVKGLYYTGQYTNPGVGVPMALISAQVVADMVTDKQKYSNKNIFRKGSTTYYYSSLFFKGQVKRDVFALYAYVRMVDNCVDKLPQDIEGFEWLWSETVSQWNGNSGEMKVVSDFIELAKRKNYSWEWIEAFWDSMRNDLKKNKYKFHELEKYIFGSAEVVGLMMARILDLPDASLKYAQLQGKAMQYINFIRDVKEDEELGRNYLGYSKKVRKDKRLWIKFIRERVAEYEMIQKEAEKGYQFIPKKYLIPIKTAADMYNWTAREIYDNPWAVWDKTIKPNKRQVVSKLIKNTISIK